MGASNETLKTVRIVISVPGSFPEEVIGRTGGGGGLQMKSAVSVKAL